MVLSMTAYARQTQSTDFGEVTWELRSVNHRFLELQYRLPENLRHVESQLREIARTHFKRGKVDCSLHFQVSNELPRGLQVNQQLATQVLQQAQSLFQYVNNPAPIDCLRLLQWPGVVEVTEPVIEGAQQAIIDVFNQAVQQLLAARQREGDALLAVIHERLAIIEKNIAIIKQSLPEIQQAQRDKIFERFNTLQLEVDKQRLEQEMLLFAQRVDVGEEIDRLITHSEEIKRVLKGKQALGRRLDFLCQELNREANTIASKSLDSALSHCAVDIKVAIEQMREQVQNIE